MAENLCEVVEYENFDYTIKQANLININVNSND